MSLHVHCDHKPCTNTARQRADGKPQDMGWYIVDTSRHFCSIQCLHAWAEELATQAEVKARMFEAERQVYLDSEVYLQAKGR